MSAKTVNEEAAQTVSPRQWIRLVVVYLLIPLILFICGGDLGWWHAWLYSMLILAAGIGGRMWAEQRHPGLTSERQNIENFQNAKAWGSHQPTRQQERQMRRFKSQHHAQRFLSCHGVVNNLFRLGRHMMKAKNYRILRERSFSEWDRVSCV